MRYGATPDATRRQPRRAAASAASRRSLTSSRPASSRLVHTRVPVSTWNRISSCCTPGSPPSIRTRSGPASTVAPVDGSSSTNSSSTPSVIAPAARTAPGRPPGTVAARSASPDPGLTTTTGWSGSGRSGSHGPSALARPTIARAAGIGGHSSAARVREAAACTATACTATACTATASAPASVTTCPAAFQAASSGCSAGIGRVRAIVSSFLSLRTRREPPARGTGNERVTGGETGVPVIAGKFWPDIPELH